VKDKIVIEVGSNSYSWDHAQVPMTLTYTLLRDIVKRIEDGDVFLDEPAFDADGRELAPEVAYQELLELKAKIDRPGFWKKFRDDPPAKAKKKSSKKKAAKKTK
jgi:hypothetical protein